jgi:YidC/Oxa1 family membrane protein insertase
MDKKNTTIGVLLLLAAFAALYFAPKSPPPTRPDNAQTATSQNGTPGTAPSSPQSGAPGATTAAAPAPANNGTFATIARDANNATITTLANDFIEARFSDFGGAIQEVAFKKYPAIQGKPEPYIFNHIHEDPLLAFTDGNQLDRNARYELVSHSANEVVYRLTIPGQVEVTRVYRLSDPTKPGGDPYRLQHETTLRNLGDAPYPAPRTLSVGTATLLNDLDTGQYLSVASFDGSDPHYVARGDLEGSRFFGSSAAKPLLESPGNITWGGVKNQFFTSIYTPEKPGSAIITKRIELQPFERTQRANVGLTGAIRFELPAIAPKGTARLAGALYVGPQERERLARLEHDEARVLPYTQYFFNKIFFSRFVAPALNFLMNTIHSWVGNWGVAIVLMTLTLKLVSLPFTLAASRSAKRMAKIQPELQAIREKYKDNPQKQQQATLEVFKKHKVNPVGGCIPVLITMPLFIGFFAMLQCTAELRFQGFLWARDLSAPDTVATIFGVPLNIMPLLMGATMFFQMQLTPTPSVDNMQVKMMKFMPIIFTFICYSFSCALSLYSTINGLFTIGQQLVINKMKDPADAGPAGPGTAAASTASALGKGMKNVTPPKKNLK